MKVADSMPRRQWSWKKEEQLQEFKRRNVQASRSQNHHQERSDSDYCVQVETTHVKQGKNYENFLSSLGTKVILQDSKNNWEREQTNFGPATTEDP